MGSNFQNPPFPGSSLLRGILMKHLFSERLCRIEFYKKKGHFQLMFAHLVKSICNASQWYVTKQAKALQLDSILSLNLAIISA